MLNSQTTHHRFVAARSDPPKDPTIVHAFDLDPSEAAKSEGDIAKAMRRAPKKKMAPAMYGMCADLFHLMRMGREYTVTDLRHLLARGGIDTEEANVRAVARNLHQYGHIEREYWNHNGDSFVLYRREKVRA